MYFRKLCELVIKLPRYIRSKVMLRIIVRSKRDADAVKAVIRKFYQGWGLNVETLKGARSIDKAMEILEKYKHSSEFIIVILGREDREIASTLESQTPLNFIIHTIPFTKVRNMRIEQLFHELELAKSKIRLTVTWDSIRKVFILQRGGIPLEDLKFNPAFDVFFGLGEKTKAYLSTIIGGRIGLNPLLVREFGGLHKVYCGPRKTGILRIPDEGIEPWGEKFTNEVYDVELSKLIESNSHVLKLYESVSLKFLKRFRDWADTVIIPWSGGKDSTAALLLALKVFGSKKVTAIYANTGLEFPWTLEYVEKVTKLLNVKVYTVYVGLNEELRRGRSLPTHSNRWCTGLKINAIEKAVNELAQGNTLVVIGDRDAESERRGRRPLAKFIASDRLIVAPIKLWSAAHVQLYLTLNNIPLNPLYTIGFYRIGCYICPALRSWEVYLMMRDSELVNSLISQPFYRDFINLRKSKNKELTF